MCHAMHQTTIFIIQLYFINELLRLEVVHIFDAKSDVKLSGSLRVTCECFIYGGI